MSSSEPRSESPDAPAPTTETTPADVLRDRRDASAMRTEAACCGAAGCRENENLWRVEVDSEVRILHGRCALKYARRKA